MKISKKSATVMLVISLILIAGCSQALTGKVLENRNPEKIVKLGVLVPLTGFGDLGEKMRRGAELAVEETNSKNKGKIKLELVVEDTKCDPKTGLTAIKKLVETDDIHIIVGPLCSGVSATVAPYAEETKTLLMHGSLAPSLRTAGDYIFRPVPGAEVLANKQAEFAKEQGIRTAAMLYAETDLGTGYSKSFKSEFEKSSGKIVAEQTFSQQTTDYRTQLLKIKQYNPEAILIIGSPNEMGTAIKQIKELGMQTKIFLPPSAESQDLIKAGGDATEGVIYAYGFDSEADKGMQGKFIAEYRQKYNQEASWHSAVGYDAVMIYSQALQSCIEEAQLVDCMKNNIYKLEYDGAQGQIIFDEYGDAWLPITMKTIKDGKFFNYEENTAP